MELMSKTTVDRVEPPIEQIREYFMYLCSMPAGSATRVLSATPICCLLLLCFIYAATVINVVSCALHVVQPGQGHLRHQFSCRPHPPQPPAAPHRPTADTASLRV